MPVRNPLHDYPMKYRYKYGCKYKYRYRCKYGYEETLTDNLRGLYGAIRQVINFTWDDVDCVNTMPAYACQRPPV